MPFTSLGLSDQLVQGILATGFTAPTEIQSRAIPVALAGKDIIGAAQTGTGKTAAFVLPILQRLTQHPHQRSHHCRALILTPTRELAHQIDSAITAYGRFLQMRTLAIYGGTNMQNQTKHLLRGVDIIIATPGRLLDHLERKTVNLSHVEVLVLDEADRMFDMGFIQDVKRIVARIPSERQTMMFSATMSKEVRELMSAIQKHPVLIEIGERRSPVNSVRQAFYTAPVNRKMELLLFMLEQKELDSVLVFSRTKHGADKISHRLQRSGIKSVAIHSNRTQAQRQRALGGFRNGEYRVLVATDVAARGIDVEGISHVVNYDIPHFPEDYIHRIGRTGRASATGDAITFVGQEETKHLKALERFTGKRYDITRYPGFDYSKPPEQPKPVLHATQDQSQSHQRERSKKFRRDDRRGSRHEKKRFSRADQRGSAGTKPKFSNEAPPPYEKKEKSSGAKSFSSTYVHPSATNKEERDWRKIIDDMNSRIRGVKKRFVRDSKR
ncbi:MAG TPA: DEAD/DEAH box helicase [Bacteroidota bacterium]|nr:DEAD/DEAH box helicase [Bacteroidota bacterium]